MTSVATKFIKFGCGCSFPLLSENKEKRQILFSPKLSELNLECSKTWDLISEGNTKGCFQLESRLGRTMAKRLKPTNINELSGLISILRPGCLEAMREGKSVSNHYIDKKNGLESINFFHPSLEPILSDTYSEMIYQEQAMSITRALAGFDLKQADDLRKAIGKKKADTMALVKNNFVEGAKAKGIVTEKEALQIFDWIEKSQRYLFNASHSISYAMNAYLSAYAKAHFPRIFFASYLRFAKDKIDPQQEIRELVRNANEMGINIHSPDFRLLNELFIIHNKDIYFGLTDIKGVGDSVFHKILSITNDIDINILSWTQIVFTILTNITSTAAQALIRCGAFDYFGRYRSELLLELDICNKITNKEKSICEAMILENNHISIIDLLKLLLDQKINKNRKEIVRTYIDTLIHPPFSTKDKIEWLSDSENELLGVNITCSKLDMYDIANANADCRSFKTSNLAKNIIILGEIASVNTVKTKKGKNPGSEMAFVTIEDQFGTLDGVVFFPEAYAQYKSQLYANNVLIFVGNKNNTKDSLIVEKCFFPTT
jgi:DNA polymerase-3 subunit alpha